MFYTDCTIIWPFSQTPQDLFRIDSATGEVFLEGTLDYETESFYRLEIEGIDNAGGDEERLSTLTDLIILVKDVQDMAPFFVNLPYLASVKEDAEVVSREGAGMT